MAQSPNKIPKLPKPCFRLYEGSNYVLALINYINEGGKSPWYKSLILEKIPDYPTLFRNDLAGFNGILLGALTTVIC